MAKFYNIEPETCSLEELEKAIEECELKAEFYNNLQQSCKVFINSVYGVFGTNFYNLANTELAESITLQGQDLIKYSVVQINDYFANMWNKDISAHEKIAERMLSKYPDFNKTKFLELAKTVKPEFDTLQKYGDSFTGDSIIRCSDDDYTVEELFNEYSRFIDTETLDGKIRVLCDKKVMSFNLFTKKNVYAPVKYIMRHKVDKRLFRITVGAHSIVCTCDHSLIAFSESDDSFVNVSPLDICDKVNDRNYYLIYVDGLNMCMSKNWSIKEIYDSDSYTYVYDIAIDTDDDCLHNVYANGILVHNTDSVDGNSMIRTEKHPDGIKISELYKENEENVGETTKAGHESVHTDDCVLNYGEYGDRYYPVTRIIRHKVSKPRWRVTLRTGERFMCTGDHSLVIWRSGERIVVKPSDVCEGDVMLTYIRGFAEVMWISQRGEFKDEYVYDIEMDDESHTFYCNDVLVHNSAYVTLQPIIDACQIPHEQHLDFDLAVYDYAMEDYLNGRFDYYAEKFNCKKNLEKFELEKITRTIILMAKKNYCCDVCWDDSGAVYEPLSHITYTGFNVVKGITTDYCREEMKNFVSFVFEKLNKGVKPSKQEIANKLKEIKKRFCLQNPIDICECRSISDYNKFILDDTKKKYDDYKDMFRVVVDINGNIVRDDDGLPKKVTVPIHVRAAAIYNNLLNTKYKRYKSRYNLLKAGDKVRFYYVNENDVFGFPADMFCPELAPKMSIDIQFDKVLLSPLNRIVSAIGYSPFPPTLYVQRSLFE